jgi:ribonucleotide monophosphatase NagD (HAD superfamily)
MTKTKTERLAKFLQNGGDITESQAQARFGIANLSATVAELRSQGYCIYTNTLKTKAGEVSLYRMGKPTREMIAVAYSKLGGQAFA